MIVRTDLSPLLNICRQRGVPVILSLISRPDVVCLLKAYRQLKEQSCHQDILRDSSSINFMAIKVCKHLDLGRKVFFNRTGHVAEYTDMPPTETLLLTQERWTVI